MRKNNNNTIKNISFYCKLILCCCIYSFVFASLCRSGTEYYQSISLNSDKVEVSEVKIITQKELLITFNGEVNADKAVFQSTDFDYMLESFVQETSTTVRLYYKQDLPKSGFHTFSYYNLIDKSGTSLWGFYSVDLGGNIMTGEACFGSVIFSEIMANPKNAPQLPDVEYIEMYNRMSYPINLNGWNYYYNYKAYTLPNLIINPGEYLAFCNSTKNKQFPEEITVYPIISFPVMNNSGKLLYLEDEEGNLIHFVEYSDKWYIDKNKSIGGYSLEIIDTDNVYPSSLNWRASNDISGGTPGRANSIIGNNPDMSRAFMRSHFIDKDNNAYMHFSKSLNPEIEKGEYLECKNGSVSDVKLNSFPFFNEIEFGLSSDDDDSAPFVVNAVNIKCLSGNEIYDPGRIEFRETSDPEPGDLLFSEILFNADEAHCKFVELYNNSNKFVNLKDLGIAVPGSNNDISTIYYLSEENAIWEPFKYLLIAVNPQMIFDQYGYIDYPGIAVPSRFPSLNAKNGKLAIVDKEKNIFELMEYSEALHNSSIGKTVNYSLERISFDIGADIATNWCSGNENTGYVSPGYALNIKDASGSAGNIIETTENFILYYPYMTLKEGYRESNIAIQYKSDYSESYIDIKIFDSKGIDLCSPYSDYIIGESGILNIDMKSLVKKRITPGIYIVMIKNRTSDTVTETKLVLPIVP